MCIREAESNAIIASLDSRITQGRLFTAEPQDEDAPALFKSYDLINSREWIVPTVMGVEKPLEDSYWAAVVAEGETGGGSFTDNNSDTQVNFMRSKSKRRQKHEFSFSATVT